MWSKKTRQIERENKMWRENERKKRNVFGETRFGMKTRCRERKRDKNKSTKKLDVKINMKKENGMCRKRNETKRDGEKQDTRHNDRKRQIPKKQEREITQIREENETLGATLVMTESRLVYVVNRVGGCYFLKCKITSRSNQLHYSVIL